MKRNLSEIVLSSMSTVRDALILIDKLALHIAVVTDENFKLLGIVTDGDVRRAILNGLSLDAPVTDIMNTNPTTVPPTFSKRQMVRIMREKSFLVLPIVEEGILVGIETMKSALTPVRHDNPVFIMAGGFGTRLRPLTDNCPKPLLKVGEKPILETILQHFINHGFHNFYISTHYLPEMIREHFKDGSGWGVSIQYVHEDKPLGTGGALGLLPDDLPDLPLIMMNGDILTNINFETLLSFHVNEKADATMCVREYQYQIPYGVVEGVDGRIQKMVEKPVQYFNINTGIYVINPSVIRNVSKEQSIGMPTLLEQEVARGKSVMMYPLHEYWLDIGQMEDYRRAQSDILNLEF